MTLSRVSARRGALVALILAGVAVMAAAPAADARKSCGKIVNPYPDSRYEGIDLKRIRAQGVACKKARRVTRGAHRKALRQPLPPDGIRRLKWHGWKVRGNLIPDHDRYVARRGNRRVRWIF